MNTEEKKAAFLNGEPFSEFEMGEKIYRFEKMGKNGAYIMEGEKQFVGVRAIHPLYFQWQTYIFGTLKKGITHFHELHF
jgi:hypothetical protein